MLGLNVWSCLLLVYLGCHLDVLQAMHHASTSSSDSTVTLTLCILVVQIYDFLPNYCPLV